MKYGRAIKIVRTASGLSQTALAERLSIGTSQLSLIEADKRSPSLKVLHEVAVALNVPPHVLTLLASAPEDVKKDVDPQYVQELAHVLLRVLTTTGEQQTLPMKGETAETKRRKTTRVPRKPRKGLPGPKS
jgi:transcriptional regulator with XRE-family HTH domain